MAYSRLGAFGIDSAPGHASTTGIPTIDYYITYKLFELPSAQEFYSEKLVTFSDFSPYYKVMNFIFIF